MTPDTFRQPLKLADAWLLPPIFNGFGETLTAKRLAAQGAAGREMRHTQAAAGA